MAAADAGLTRGDVAARAGVDASFVDALVAAAVLTPAADGLMTAGDVRRVILVRSMEDGGIPLDAISAGLRQGVLTLDFADAPVYERFAGLADETFEDVSRRTGVPVPLLLVIREAIGSGPVEPSDRLRDDELAVVPFLELQVKLGFHHEAIGRLLRAMGDSLRRVAEAEAEWYQSEVAVPLMESGRATEIGDFDPQTKITEAMERAFLAIYHAQEAQTWSSNVVAGFAWTLARAGIHQPAERSPAICFLDVTGYTRLTQERGDRAAAELAEELARLVKRSSIEHRGRPVKWLGDGVMLYFRDPADGVVAAIRMVEGITEAGLPPAHVGLHAGPVVVQQGDYYGQTVNMASRIAEYARPGEVLVSQAVVDATVGTGGGAGIAFVDIGAVELKGVAGVVRLHAARPAA